MDNAKLAALLYPHITVTPEEYLTKIYPKRDLPAGAAVTRFAPSPTGFIHIGNLFTSLVVERSAHQSGGVAMLRIEDTDKKREKEDGITGIVRGLKGFGIAFDEGALDPHNEVGAYGPYIQSRRAEIYQSFAKSLVEKGFAYPCFCSEDDISAIRAEQEKAGALPGYYGEYARCRELTYEQVEENLKAGREFVLRLRSPGKPGGRIKFKDVVRGDMEFDENILDLVLLKRDGIPTYHFAHVVDDTLMGTTHVIRGDEWLPSVPTHLQLFYVLGLKPMKYIHVAPIMKEENGSKRKLSKRKDPEAAASWFLSSGYPRDALMEYLMTILNSNFEDWRKQNKTNDWREFPFDFKKMSQSGALFDLTKLDNVSQNYISRMTAEEVLESVTEWAKEYEPALYDRINADKNFALGIFGIDRGGPKPRKDLKRWNDVSEWLSYFYEAPVAELTEEQKEIVRAYIGVMDLTASKDEWFNAIKDLCRPLGYCPDVKEFKKAPEGTYKGHVGDVSGAVRIAVTGRTNTPDLHAIMCLLGREECLARLNAAL